MQRLRSLHTKSRYTQVSNSAIDRLPDLNSLGLLVTYLRHHDNYHFDLKTFLRSKAGVGEKAGYKARRTLIEFGYLVQVKYRHSYRGRFHTEIWRSAEPFTVADLVKIADEYVVGSRKLLPLGDDDADLEVVVRWVEVTSFRGVEVFGGRDLPAEPVGEQCSPVPGLAGTAPPGTAEPGTYKKNSENTEEKNTGGGVPPPPPDPLGGLNELSPLSVVTQKNLFVGNQQTARVRVAVHEHGPDCSCLPVW